MSIGKGGIDGPHDGSNPKVVDSLTSVLGPRPRHTVRGLVRLRDRHDLREGDAEPDGGTAVGATGAAGSPIRGRDAGGSRRASRSRRLVGERHAPHGNGPAGIPIEWPGRGDGLRRHRRSDARAGSRSGTRGGGSIHGRCLGPGPLRGASDAVRPVDPITARTAPVSQAEHRGRSWYSALCVAGIGRGDAADHPGRPSSRLGVCDPSLALFHSAARPADPMDEYDSLDGWAGLRSRDPGNHPGDPSVQVHASFPVVADRLLHPVFGLDAVASHHGFGVRRPRPDLGLQWPSVDGAVRMGVWARAEHRRASAGAQRWTTRGVGLPADRR